jgi:hypothetical protein
MSTERLAACIFIGFVHLVGVDRLQIVVSLDDGRRVEVKVK